MQGHIQPAGYKTRFQRAFTPHSLYNSLSQNQDEVITKALKFLIEILRHAGQLTGGSFNLSQFSFSFFYLHGFCCEFFSEISQFWDMCPFEAPVIYIRCYCLRIDSVFHIECNQIIITHPLETTDFQSSK